AHLPGAVRASGTARGTDAARAVRTPLPRVHGTHRRTAPALAGDASLMPIEIRPLTAADLAAVTRNAKVIERDAHGDKVLMLADGRYLKYFRRKRTWNRDLLVPAAVRFTRHARHLSRLGIPTLEVTGLH